MILKVKLFKLSSAADGNYAGDPVFMFCCINVTISRRAFYLNNNYLYRVSFFLKVRF